jgi:hypothetical protein
MLGNKDYTCTQVWYDDARVDYNFWYLKKKSLESEIKEWENKGTHVISNQKIIIREYAKEKNNNY